jgi:hypothetical protein
MFSLPDEGQPKADWSHTEGNRPVAERFKMRDFKKESIAVCLLLVEVV